MTPILVFDIETVPDVTGLRKVLELPADMVDRDVAEIAFQRRRAQTGGDFLQLHMHRVVAISCALREAPGFILHMHRVVAISCALREAPGFKVWSLGTPEDSEKELIQRFFDGIDKF